MCMLTTFMLYIFIAGGIESRTLLHVYMYTNMHVCIHAVYMYIFIAGGIESRILLHMYVTLYICMYNKGIFSLIWVVCVHRMSYIVTFVCDIVHVYMYNKEVFFHMAGGLESHAFTGCRTLYMCMLHCTYVCVIRNYSFTWQVALSRVRSPEGLQILNFNKDW